MVGNGGKIIMADTNEQLQQAIAAARAGKTSEAKELAERLVEENPENPHALFLLGMLVDSREEQREYMQKVLEIDPDHKAANKRMAQLGPAEEPEALVEEPAEEVEGAEPQDIEAEPQAIEAEPQEIEADLQEEEPTLDETIVGATAVAQETIVGEVEGEELPEYDEMVEEFPEEVESPMEFVDEPPVEDVEEPLAIEQEDQDFGVAETIAGGVVASQALETETPEMEEEEIPDWLFEEAQSEEELLEIDETQLWTDEPPPVEEDLPDWLQEDVSEEYVDPYSKEEFVDVSEEGLEPEELPEESEAMAPAVAAGVAADAGSFEDDTFEDFEEPAVEPAPAEPPKKRKSSANRGLEILLIVLIIIALIVVGVLGYLIISPPF
jgi:tetratricopeptide (TPR) repeat protein